MHMLLSLQMHHACPPSACKWPTAQTWYSRPTITVGWCQSQASADSTPAAPALSAQRRSPTGQTPIFWHPPEQCAPSNTSRTHAALHTIPEHPRPQPCSPPILHRSTTHTTYSYRHAHAPIISATLPPPVFARYRIRHDTARYSVHPQPAPPHTIEPSSPSRPHVPPPPRHPAGASPSPSHLRAMPSAPSPGTARRIQFTKRRAARRGGGEALRAGPCRERASSATRRLSRTWAWDAGTGGGGASARLGCTAPGARRPSGACPWPCVVARAGGVTYQDEREPIMYCWRRAR
ncbi:hypothetical protein BC628DRAFT_1100829 [Trametes gibbosa]|nr:hypothetical protein BC628DRAFT_1100829 [Trametes gibbosa]